MVTDIESRKVTPPNKPSGGVGCGKINPVPLPKNYLSTNMIKCEEFECTKPIKHYHKISGRKCQFSGALRRLIEKSEPVCKAVKLFLCPGDHNTCPTPFKEHWHDNKKKVKTDHTSVIESSLQDSIEEQEGIADALAELSSVESDIISDTQSYLEITHNTIGQYTSSSHLGTPHGIRQRNTTTQQGGAYTVDEFIIRDRQHLKKDEKIPLIDNRGGGLCFYYSLIHAMNNQYGLSRSTSEREALKLKNTIYQTIKEWDNSPDVDKHFQPKYAWFDTKYIDYIPIAIGYDVTLITDAYGIRTADSVYTTTTRDVLTIYYTCGHFQAVDVAKYIATKNPVGKEIVLYDVDNFDTLLDICAEHNLRDEVASSPPMPLQPLINKIEYDVIVQQEYSVCGYTSEGDNPIRYIERIGVEVNEYRDLRRVDYTIATRNIEWFKTFKEGIRWFEDITSFERERYENAYFYCVNNRVVGAMSKTLFQHLCSMRLHTIITPLTLRQAHFIATSFNIHMPIQIAICTFYYFLEHWTTHCSQLQQFADTIEKFLKDKNMPMRVNTNIGFSQGVYNVIKDKTPPGVYSHQGLLRSDHITSADYGNIDEPKFADNGRWIPVKFVGARYAGPYIQFNTTSNLMRSFYNTCFCVFGTKTGVVYPTATEATKALLRMTADLYGRDMMMARQQASILATPDKIKWLEAMGVDMSLYVGCLSCNDNPILLFERCRLNTIKRAIIDPGTYYDDLASYIISIGAKVPQRQRVLAEHLQTFTFQQKGFNEALIKKNEFQKYTNKIIKFNGKETVLEGVKQPRLFITLPDGEWIKGNPLVTYKYKKYLSTTIYWTKNGFFSDDGFDKTPNPGTPWMHTNLLYPVINEVVQIDQQHFSIVMEDSIAFVIATQGIATMAHGDDIYYVRWDGKVKFGDRDAEKFDNTHTGFIFAGVALKMQQLGIYDAAPFTQCQRDVRLYNPDNTKEYGQLKPRHGFYLPSGSGLTTGLNTDSSECGCCALAQYGVEHGLRIMGYESSGSESEIVERQTMLARFFTQIERGWVAILCPGVILRKFGQYCGDFPVIKGGTVMDRGFCYCAGIIRGYKHEPASSLMTAFRRRFLDINEYIMYEGEYTILEVAQIDEAICRHANLDIMVYMDLVDVVLNLKYGDVIIHPAVDALCKARYGLEPASC